jgi:hypothetical protein
VKLAQQTTDDEALSSDVLWGIIAIARYLGRSPRQTAYLIEKGEIPVKRLGPRTIAARKSELDALISAQQHHN